MIFIQMNYKQIKTDNNLIFVTNKILCTVGNKMKPFRKFDINKDDNIYQSEVQSNQ